MSKKHVYLRPKNPASGEVEEQALDALVQWGMACKTDFDKREAEKRRATEERGSSPPPSSTPPMAARSRS